MEHESSVYQGWVSALESRDIKGFAEPWMARAFGLVSVIAESDLFSLIDFQHALIESIRKTEISGCIKDEEDYYNCWISALEDLLEQKQILKDDLIQNAENKIMSNSAAVKEHQHLSVRDENGQLLIKPLYEF